MSVERILTAKGYDNEQIQAIVYENPNFDDKVRSEFSINEPIHLWEAYYIGDANEDVLNEIAIAKGYEDYVELLKAMDNKLIELADEYPAIGVQCLLIDDLDEFCDEYCRIKDEPTCGLFDDNGDEADGSCYIIPLYELPAEMSFEQFGEIAWAKKIEYNPENRPNASNWIGWSSTGIGYIAL